MHISYKCLSILSRQSNALKIHSLLIFDLWENEKPSQSFQNNIIPKSTDALKYFSSDIRYTNITHTKLWDNCILYDLCKRNFINPNCLCGKKDVYYFFSLFKNNANGRNNFFDHLFLLALDNIDINLLLWGNSRLLLHTCINNSIFAAVHKFIERKPCRFN